MSHPQSSLLRLHSDCRLQNLVNVRIWISFQGCTGQQIIERPFFHPHGPAISLINPMSLGLSRLITPPFFFSSTSPSYFLHFSLSLFFLKEHPRDTCIFHVPCKRLTFTACCSCIINAPAGLKKIIQSRKNDEKIANELANDQNNLMRIEIFHPSARKSRVKYRRLIHAFLMLSIIFCYKIK